MWAHKSALAFWCDKRSQNRELPWRSLLLSHCCCLLGPAWLLGQQLASLWSLAWDWMRCGCCFHLHCPSSAELCHPKHCAPWHTLSFWITLNSKERLIVLNYRDWFWGCNLENLFLLALTVFPVRHQCCNIACAGMTLLPHIGSSVLGGLLCMPKKMCSASNGSNAVGQLIVQVQQSSVNQNVMHFETLTLNVLFGVVGIRTTATEIIDKLLPVHHAVISGSSNNVEALQGSLTIGMTLEILKHPFGSICVLPPACLESCSVAML